MKTSLLTLTFDEFQEKVIDLGLKPFVAKQCWEWVFKKSVATFDEMSNVSKMNRDVLNKHFRILPFHSVQAYPSKDRLATKYVIEIAPHQYIEAVALVEKDYETLCVSSQSGCPVACGFCLTGYAGFKFNLTSDMILAQLLLARSKGHDITHLVFMGMGEPLLNYDNVFSAIDVITSPEGFGISKRKITVSTSGYLAGIKRMIADDVKINLAFSVGNADSKKRVQIMPIEERNPLGDVIKALQAYHDQHNRKLTLEYTLLLGVNDQDSDMASLGRLAKLLNAKVNLINLNPHPKIPYKPVPSETMRKFKSYLTDHRVRATIRFTKGQDIVAACGQLGESILKDSEAKR